LWDVQAEKKRTLPHEDENISAASWTENGLLALGTARGRCLLCRLPALESVQELPSGPPITELSLSRDGRWLAVALSNKVRLWDVRRQSFVGNGIKLPGEVRWLVFDGKGTRLAIASADNAVRIYQLDIPAEEDGPGKLRRLAGPLVNWATQYNFNSHLAPVWIDDDRGVLTCAAFDEVAQWDPNTGKEVRRLKPNLWNVDAIVPSPNGRYVAITGWHGCQLYDTRSGNAVGPRMQHTNRVPCVAFSADSRVLLTGAVDQTIQLWSVPDGHPQAGLRLSHEVFATAFFGQGFMAGQMDGLIRLWRPGQLTLPYRDYAVPAEKHLDYSRFVDAQGRYLLTRVPNNGARVIDLESGKPTGEVLKDVGQTFHGAFVPRSSQIVIQTAEKLTVWDWRTGRIVWGPEQLPSTGYSVDVSPDGRRLVSLCADRGWLVDTKTGKLIAEIVHEGKPDLLNSAPRIRFSPDGSRFVTYRAWSTVIVWDATTGRSRNAPWRHGDRATALAFSTDGRYLATGSDDYTARVFDLAKGRELAKLETPHWVFGVAFDTDGKRLLTSNRNGSAQLWDWREGKKIGPPMSHAGEVYGGLFLPGTPWLLTVATVPTAGATVQAWDSLLGKPLTLSLLMRSRDGRELRLVSGNRQLAAFGYAAGRVRVFDLSPLADDNPHRLSPEQLQSWAEIQSMEKIHEGGVARLTTSEWLERWRKLQREKPDLATWAEKQPRPPDRP
jgi:WD40 repeat protein